ncbi:hypothetical protein [Pleionea litopenaei]|uniref:Uncharacterized protein n=1 Tax=Pleionea litopenaei TaxID=3070815 RepID=A0AA51X7Y0_9GAMM|nr:hypothetical protein [Pleionea sp. HL-JVS1]WMS88703.1 hypothetical protein Q9312_07250 [Pleionea sp. HL-JVS1]
MSGEEKDKQWQAIEQALQSLPREMSPERSRWNEIAQEIAPQTNRSGWMPYAVAASVLVAIASTWFSVQTSLELKSLKQQQFAYQAAQEQIQYREHQRRLVKASFVENLNMASEQLDPATIADIQNNLAIIEQAMLDIKAALAKQPGNQRLNDLLQQTYTREQQLIESVEKSYPQLRGEA